MAKTSSTKPEFDLRLYLVTDSTSALLGDKNLCQAVEAAIKGGVTIVQYRDKLSDTDVLIETARKLLEVTRRYRVPLIINDNLAVCRAVGAEGVHIGQDDMHISEARKLLGPNAIIGVSVSTAEEATRAIFNGADYLGIGTIFKTNTKTDTSSIIGTRGAQKILSACKTGTGYGVGCVAIGGINASNVQRVLHQAEHRKNRLNGVAVVSAIISAEDVEAAAAKIRRLISSASTSFYVVSPGTAPVAKVSALLHEVPAIIKRHTSSNILCHNMTNTVVQNFAANVCLATGSSPIMSVNGPEAPDLAKLGGGLVINMGTVTPGILKNYILGMKAYNATANPILLDPVGAGATSIRRAAVKELLAEGFFDVIKGNEGEIMAVIGDSEVQQHGVDSGTSTNTPSQKAEMIKSLAQRERCIVLMTGATDFLSDGTRTFAISNGSHWLSHITGSGCALGSVVASYVAVHRSDKLLAALGGLLHYEIAAERAAERLDVKGPGSFIPAFLDELYALGKTVVDGGNVYIDKRAKIESF